MHQIDELPMHADVQMPGRHQVRVDRSRDALLTDFGRATLDDRYLMPGEGYQDLFARVASYYGDDAAHAQRIYDYISRMWFMPATPVLSNGGTTRGLPISCLTGDMLINVPGGFKPIAEIESGDKVLTHRGRWRRVVAKASRTADDLFEMVVDRRRTKLRITGNHPILTQHGWVRVDQLDSRRHRIAINRSLTHVEQGHVIDLSLHCPYEAEIRAGALVALSTNVRLDKRPEHGTRSYYAAPKASIGVDEELAWALGLWFAGGSLTRTPSGTPNGIRITVGHDEGDLAERWADIMRRRFGVHAMAYASEVERNGKPNRWISVNANSTAVGAFFGGEFGEKATDKFIPDWVMSLPRPCLRAFLDAFIEGDGCEHDAGMAGRFRYTTIGINNPALMGGLYNIALVLGIDASMRLDKPAGRLASRPVYQEMTLHPNGFHARHEPLRREGEAVQYVKLSGLRRLEQAETVYDIQVEEDESFSVAGVVVHNCFLNEATDSLDGIVGLWNENVWLASKGGGIGSYWGNLRSIGEKVGLNGKTSGVIPFIRVMDSLTLAISQGSLRRGSAAVYLPVSHPEVEEFTELRRPTGGDPNRKALNLHHGIQVSDSFMRAVEADEEWALTSPKDGAVVRKVSARNLWIRILTARIETGEPYLVFSDHVNNARPEQQKLSGLEVKTSNLCSEITLPTGIDHHGKQRTAVCCLASLNLETWLEWHDHPLLIEDVMRFLDNVLQDFIDRAPEGMERAKYSAMRERSVGLGVMGFHSFLQSQGVPFEGVVAKVWNRRMFKHIRAQADTASRMLAHERGACPDAEEYGIMERFSNKMAIAPTASISIIAGNTSPGIEPIAANVFLQKTLSGSFSVRNRHLQQLLAAKGMDTDAIWSSITLNKGSVQHLDGLTEQEKAVYRTAFELDQRWVVEHAADRTPFICQSQSVNLFLPANLHKRDLHQIHMMAWKRGVKSLYYCRSLSIQRADSVSEKAVRPAEMATAAPSDAGRMSLAGAAKPNNYEECLACQ